LERRGSWRHRRSHTPHHAIAANVSDTRQRRFVRTSARIDARRGTDVGNARARISGQSGTLRARQVQVLRPTRALQQNGSAFSASISLTEADNVRRQST